MSEVLHPAQYSLIEQIKALLKKVSDLEKLSEFRELENSKYEEELHKTYRYSAQPKEKNYKNRLMPQDYRVCHVANLNFKKMVAKRFPSTPTASSSSSS